MHLLHQDLAKCMPGLKEPKLSQYILHLESAMAMGEITAPYRAAAFLAQLGHESIDLTHWEEIGGPKLRYAPYYGRGPIQLTWRQNYLACGNALMLDLVGQPDLVLRPDVGFRVAVWFWRGHGLNALADAIQVDGRDSFDEISRRIQGRAAPQNSLDQRWSRYLRCFDVMNTPTVII